MKIIANVFVKMSKLADRISNKINPPPAFTEFEIAVQKWFAVNGDRTLRTTYDLGENSIVFDIGGYEGQWASDIFSKYQSVIYIFEPVLEFYENIEQRFQMNSKMKIFHFGLGSETEKSEISLSNNSSSTQRSIGLEKEIVQIISLADFVNEQGIKNINLMKINIEGGEFDLLEHMIETNLISSVENIQVQFHQFVNNAELRMKKIQNSLALTHHLTYQFPFVWENWERNTTAVL